MEDQTHREPEFRRSARLLAPIVAQIGSSKERRDTPTVRGQLVLTVGVAEDPDRPLIHVETLNLVLDPSKEFGGGTATPSIRLGRDEAAAADFDPESGELAAKLALVLDVPAERKQREARPDPRDDAPDPQTHVVSATLRGRFLEPIRANSLRQEVMEFHLQIEMPPDLVEREFTPAEFEMETILTLKWLRFRPRRQLMIQPVFIAASGSTPSTGSDFYPGLVRANELWGKCCIEFVAKCPPIYVDKQEYRIATAAEAMAFKDEVDVSDAIEVFMVERLDPEDMWGGGATWGSGTAAAKIVSGDNQLPLNRNHMAHELGHVLSLCHPGSGCTGTRADGCVGSLMEPSGFYADNPDYQCWANCTNASNPLLCAIPFRWCISRVYPQEALVAAERAF